MTDTDKLTEIIVSFGRAQESRTLKETHSAILDLFTTLVPEEDNPKESLTAIETIASASFNNCRSLLIARIESLRK